MGKEVGECGWVSWRLTSAWLQDVKLAGVSRQEGNPLDVPLAAAEPTPEVSVSGDRCSE